jgi:hypothetical protein
VAPFPDSPRRNAKAGDRALGRATERPRPRLVGGEIGPEPSSRRADRGSVRSTQPLEARFSGTIPQSMLTTDRVPGSPSAAQNDGGRCRHRPPLSRVRLPASDGSVLIPRADRSPDFPVVRPASSRVTHLRIAAIGSPHGPYPALQLGPCLFAAPLPEGLGSAWTVWRVGSASACTIASRSLLARPARIDFRFTRHRQWISPRRRMRISRVGTDDSYAIILRETGCGRLQATHRPQYPRDPLATTHHQVAFCGAKCGLSSAFQV